MTEDARKTLLGKRFAAALIDGTIGIVILFAAGIASTHLGALLCSLYILFKDGWHIAPLKGRSFGKTVLKIQPIRLDGGIMDLKTSALRNWTLALPSFFDAIASGWFYGILSIIGFVAIAGELFLTLTQHHGRRFGDHVAHTEIR